MASNPVPCDSSERIAYRLQFLPEGARVEVFADLDWEIYRYNTAKDSVLAIYKGRAGRPTYCYSFRDDSGRESLIDRLLNDRRQEVERTIAREAALKLATSKMVETIKAGAVLYASWGCEQTNIDFYEVVGVHGKTQVSLRELKKNQVVKNPSDFCGYCEPVLGQYEDNTVIKRKIGGGFIQLKPYKFAFLWDEKPKYFSTYA